MAKSTAIPRLKAEQTAIGVSYSLPAKPTKPYEEIIAIVNGSIEIMPNLNERNSKTISKNTITKLPSTALSIPQTIKFCQTLFIYVRPDHLMVMPLGTGLFFIKL